MKNIIALSALLLLFNSCETVETKPSTSTTEEGDFAEYIVQNAGKETITFMYYKSSADFMAGTGAVFGGTLDSGETMKFTLDKFSGLSETTEYYLDWYSMDMAHSADVDYLKGRQLMYKDKKHSPNTTTHKIGTKYNNYERKVLFGSKSNPVWYDVNDPTGTTLTFNRGGRVNYLKDGKTSNASYSFFEGTSYGKQYMTCEIHVGSFTGTISLKNGDAYSVPYGGNTFVEVEVTNGTTKELRKFRYRY